MNIIVDAPTQNISLGWLNALRAAGHNAHELTASPFLQFAEQRPDLIVLAGRPDPSMQRCLAAHPEVRVVTHYDFRPAFDDIRWKRAEPSEEFGCDICFVGRHTPQRASVLSSLAHNHHLRIFGRTPWPFPEYQGVISDELIPKLYASSKYCFLPEDNPLSDRSRMAWGLGNTGIDKHGTVWHGSTVTYADLVFDFFRGCL